MAYYKGTDGVIKSGTTAIAQIDSFEITQEIETAEATSIGDNSKKFVPTLKAFNGSLVVSADSDDAGQATLTNGAEVTLLAQLEGSATGRQQLSGNVIVNNISTNIEPSGIIKSTMSFIGNGDLTITDIS